MFAEFGPAPLCLELDFDSYDGPWQHVSRFRRSSGWLLVAKATIQSEHDILTAKLVAACDEHENAIPSFQAQHLTQCDWINPTYCEELPPDILDDLICEQEGELVRRWHREKNAGLAEAFEAQEQRIAEIEGRVRSAVRRNERQVAELRQRRRHPEATPEMRAALAAIIGDLTEENDELVAELAVTREAIRVQAEAAEEALWLREDLLIEVEPLHLIRWSALQSSRYAPPPSSRTRQSQYVPACGRTGLNARTSEEVVQQAAASLKAKADAEAASAAVSTEEPAVPPSEQGAALPSTIAAWTKKFGAPDHRKGKLHRLDRPWTDDRIAALRRMWEHGYHAIRIATVLRNISAEQVASKAAELGLARSRSPTAARSALPGTIVEGKKPKPPLAVTHCDDRLDPAPSRDFEGMDPVMIRRKLKQHTVDSPGRRRLLELLAESERLPQSDACGAQPGVCPSRTPDTPPQLQPPPAPLALRKLNAERDKLRLELSAVMIRGQKYFEGSKKYNRNREQRTELKANIAALDRKIKMAEDRRKG